MSSIFKRNYLAKAVTTLVLIFAATGALKAQSVEDFSQPKNNDPSNIVWVSSILNNTNSQYAEGMSVPQRYIVSGLTGTTHSLKMKHQSVKSGTHAYDFLTSWQQAYATGAYFAVPPFTNMLDSLFTLQCGDNISHTGQPICIALHAGGFFMDINCPDALGTINGDDVAARITAYEAVFG